jgi:bifunctional DNA-binding transcriptional regulator/antitoxin component of YhaV-PrlF toxin-antitoxin module
MDHVIHTQLSGARRVVIPADLCRHYGIEPGGPVVLEPTESGIVLRPLHAVIRDVQAYFADVAPAGVSLSEELLAERRQEAERETRD